jgi:hypothetical protein
MATKPVASLKSTLLARKGEAAPTPTKPPPLRADMVRVTLMLSADEHVELVKLGLMTRPRRSNQEMMREAVQRYLKTEVARLAHGEAEA